MSGESASAAHMALVIALGYDRKRVGYFEIGVFGRHIPLELAGPPVEFDEAPHEGPLGRIVRDLHRVGIWRDTGAGGYIDVLRAGVDRQGKRRHGPAGCALADKFVDLGG